LVQRNSNTYQVDPMLAGRKVELVFDPFDLTTVEVRHDGVPRGTAVPHHVGRHAHPKARPETPPAPPASTGINYARLLDAAHHAELARRVNYAALTGSTPETHGEIPGQLDLLTGEEMA
jgi:putative transposase